MSDLVDLKTLKWIKEPERYIFMNDKLIMETRPGTSFHALRYDMTQACGMKLEPMRSFMLTLKVSYDFHDLGDECGVMIRYDNTQWAKAGIENMGDHYDLSCTLFSNGFGDRSCREIGNGIRWMYFRVLYWSGNLKFQYSFNGKKYSDMRWFHIAGSNEKIETGFYACSSGKQSYDCVFSDVSVRRFQE